MAKPTPIQKWLPRAKRRFGTLPGDQPLQLHFRYEDATRLAEIIGVDVLGRAPSLFSGESVRPGQENSFWNELNLTARKFETQTARGIYPFYGDVLGAVKALKAELVPIAVSLDRFSTTVMPPGFFETLKRPTLKPIGDGTYRSELIFRLKAIRKLISETVENLDETEKVMRAKARSPRRKYPGLEPAAFCLIGLYEHRTGRTFTYSPYQWKEKGVVPVHIRFVHEALRFLAGDVPEAAISAAIRAASSDFKKRRKIALTGGVAPGSE